MRRPLWEDDVEHVSRLLGCISEPGLQLDEENVVVFQLPFALITGSLDQALCAGPLGSSGSHQRDGCLSGTEWSRMRSMTLGSGVGSLAPWPS